MRKQHFLKLVIIVLFILFFYGNSFSYHGITHGGVTSAVENQNNIVKNYLEKIGFPDGRNTTFTLNPGKYWVPGGIRGRFVTALDIGGKNLFDYDKTLFNFSYDGTHYSALNWLIVGSILEDVPLTDRAIHHFHDPTNLQGLSEIFTGTSARTRAFDDTTRG